MEQLPLLALVEVLEQLPYGDLLRSRRVSKQWKHLIDHSVSKHELVLFIETHRRPIWWEHSGAPINLANSIQVNYSVFISEPFFRLFKNVKRLLLSFNHFFFSQRLTNNLASNFGATLEHLQIDFLVNRSLEERNVFQLTLRNLQSFSFVGKTHLQVNSRIFRFLLNCDRLTHLNVGDNLTLNDSMIARVASNLRVLSAWLINYEGPVEFPNLEVLMCYNAPSTQFLISSLPNLKKFVFAGDSRVSFIEAKRRFDEFLRSIEEQKRMVDVFWFGLKFTLENSDRLFETLAQTENHVFFQFTSKVLSFFKENRSLIDFNLYHIGSKPVIFSHSFGDQLDEHADRELMENLSRSWYSIVLLEFSSQFNVAKLSNLFEFVSNVSISGNLKQIEFDALPAIFPNLRTFGITFFCDSKSFEYVDFSFVSKLKSLYLFQLLAPLSLANLDQMLSECRYLYFVSFSNGQKNLYVRIRYRHLVQPEFRFELGFRQNPPESFYFKEKGSLLEFLDINGLVRKEKECKLSVNPSFL